MYTRAHELGHPPSPSVKVSAQRTQFLVSDD